MLGNIQVCNKGIDSSLCCSWNSFSYVPGMLTCFKAIIHWRCKRMIQISLEGAAYSRLHPHPVLSNDFCAPVWQWENLIWPIRWNSEHASTYHLECKLSWRLKIARITVLWPTRRFNTIPPYHNGYIEMIYVCHQVHAYNTVCFAHWDFTLDETYVNSSHNLHALRFISSWTYIPENERPGWGNCLYINSRRGGISPTCSDNLVLTIHVNSNITQPQKLLGLDTCRTSRQAVTFKNPGVRLRTSPMAVLCWAAWKKALQQLDSVRTKFKGSNSHCAAPVEEPLQMSKTRWAAYPLSDFGFPAGHLVQHNLIA
jgi:hypothetical protein